MPYYDVYDSNDNLIASDVWIDTGSDSGWTPINPKEAAKLIAINVTFILWCLLFVILPLMFIFLIIPEHANIGDALLSGGAMIVLWLFSIVNIFINVKRKIFIHKLVNSQEEKYVALRKELFGNKNTDTSFLLYSSIIENDTDTEDLKSEDELFVEEIKNPLKRTLKYLRLSLIGIFVGILALSIIFSKYNVTTYALAFVGPLFAYSYIFDIVSSYVTYGKKANWIWLGLFIAVAISSFLIGFEILKPIFEYLLFLFIIGINEIIFRIIDKKEIEK